MKYNQILGFVLLMGVFVFFGCGDDDPTGPGDDGMFTATISGDINKSLSGNAWFWSGVIEGESGFVLWLFSEIDNEDIDDAIWFSREGTTRPGTGQYVISNYENWGEEGWNPQHFMAWYTGDETIVWSVSGSITLTTSTSNRVAGNFQFQASGMSSQNQGDQISVTISGEFDAIGTNFNM